MPRRSPSRARRWDTRRRRDLLRAVFAERAGFFLTGGTALAEYYLHHRRSEDLDLFTTDDIAFATGASLIEAAARKLGATVQWMQTRPQFRRGVVSRGSESVVVDLVRVRLFALLPEKRKRRGSVAAPLQGSMAEPPV